MPMLPALFDQPLKVVWLPLGGGRDSQWLGWGAKASARCAEFYAKWFGGKAIRLEDGFLRSFGTGEHFPPLSLVVDEQGIYYDSTRPSALETLLASSADVLDGIADEVRRAKALVLEHRLSKYNHAPDCEELEKASTDSARTRPLPSADGTTIQSTKPASGQVAGYLPQAREGVKRVLVIDQTAGDLSVSLGAASAETFAAMLAAAWAENPGATIYVKTHPEVASGRKGGYLTHVRDDERTVVLREPVNPLSLIEQMDRVYVVSSTMGFEALLAGKPVSVFGMPWYAGWGATDDRQTCGRRTRTRTVDELFAAAYFHYARYLNPETHARGTIFDVIGWLVRQRGAADPDSGAGRRKRKICIGYRRWKAANIMPMLSLERRQAHFVPTVAAAEEMGAGADDDLVFWGRTPPEGLQELAGRTGARLLRMEDGFIRSVGLGSDLIRPLSLVLDARGIYFDPSQPSDLEHILNTVRFTEDDFLRARRVRQFIVDNGITKYNLEPRESATWNSGGKRVVLVPGQVEDDASIRFGCRTVNTNLGLLRAAREARPDAFIVYKPHPDVMSSNRAGKVALGMAREYADHVEARLSVVSCIAACDEVHTMTSLTGFDALLRNKRVVVYGQPFYAGWGLTEDVEKEGVAFARRQRVLSLDELVAGALLHYPLYWDWELKGYTTCEAVLRQIAKTRDHLEASGRLEKLRVGFFRRQWRKLGILARTSIFPG